MKALFFTVSLLFLESCYFFGKHENRIAERQTFRLPIYDIQYGAEGDSAQLLSLDSIMPHYPTVMRTKFTFQDTILQMKIHRGWEYKQNFGKLDTTVKSSEGLTIWADYKQSIIPRSYPRNYVCYPVYIINKQENPRLFTGKDSHVFAIHEALHPNGKWYPIEKRGFDFCGNGHWQIVLNPREYAIFFMPKYQGKFRTKLRIRLRMGGKLLFSQPVVGYISMNQFLFGVHDKKRALDNLKYLKHDFYGALSWEFAGDNFP